jgi:cell division protein FtsL
MPEQQQERPVQQHAHEHGEQEEEVLQENPDKLTVDDLLYFALRACVNPSCWCCKTQREKELKVQRELHDKDKLIKAQNALLQEKDALLQEKDALLNAVIVQLALLREQR